MGNLRVIMRVEGLLVEMEGFISKYHVATDKQETTLASNETAKLIFDHRLDL